MKLLLDTHALIWLRHEPRRLSEAATSAISSSDNEVVISTTSLAEMAIKTSIGKLTVSPTFYSTIERTGMSLEPFTRDAAVTLATLPLHHRDPFDRMLIAQAICAEYAIVSTDRRFEPYEVRIVW
jgi:PIN domain nuclease of toxin-antitoxin system